MNMHWARTALAGLLIVGVLFACAAPESQPPQEALQQAVTRLKTEAAGLVGDPSRAEAVMASIDAVMARFDDLQATTRQARHSFIELNLQYEATAEDFEALFQSQGETMNAARLALAAARQEFQSQFNEAEWLALNKPVSTVVAEMSRSLNAEEG